MDRSSLTRNLALVPAPIHSRTMVIAEHLLQRKGVVLPAETKACYDCSDIAIGDDQIRSMIPMGSHRLCVRCAIKRLPKVRCRLCGSEFRSRSKKFCSYSCKEMAK